MYFCLPPQNLEVVEVVVVEVVVEVEVAAALEVEPQWEWAAFSKEVCQSCAQLEVKTFMLFSTYVFAPVYCIWIILSKNRYH